MDNLFIQFSCSTTVTLTTVVVLFLSTIVLLKKYCKRRDGSSSSRNTATSPPISIPLGTLGWPFIGETIEFITCAYSDRSESFMDKRKRVYGKVFMSHVFGSPTIVSTDAEVRRVVLQSDSKNFIPSYPRSLTELMGKSSILLINGNLQKRIHGLIGSFFESSHIKAQITLDMQKYVQESMALWRDDQLIYIQDETKNVAFHVLVKALISLDPGREMQSLKQDFQQFIAGLMSLPINIPRTQLYRSLQARKRMVKFVQKVIQERMNKNSESSKAGSRKDVVDVLLNDANEQLTLEQFKLFIIPN